MIKINEHINEVSEDKRYAIGLAVVRAIRQAEIDRLSDSEELEPAA